MTISITVGHGSDAEALSILAIRTFTETFGYLYSPENLRLHLEKTCSTSFFAAALKHDKIYIARDNEKLIGYTKFGGLGLPVENPPDNTSEIHRLYVVQPYQRMRVGAALMDKIMQHELMQSSSAIYLGVWENNLRAQHFYKRYNFNPIGEYMYPVGTQLDREIIMVRNQ